MAGFTTSASSAAWGLASTIRNHVASARGATWMIFSNPSLWFMFEMLERVASGTKSKLAQSGLWLFRMIGTGVNLAAITNIGGFGSAAAAAAVGAASGVAGAATSLYGATSNKLVEMGQRLGIPALGTLGVLGQNILKRAAVGTCGVGVAGALAYLAYRYLEHKKNQNQPPVIPTRPTPKPNPPSSSSTPPTSGSQVPALSPTSSWSQVKRQVNEIFANADKYHYPQVEMINRCKSRKRGNVSNVNNNSK